MTTDVDGAAQRLLQARRDATRVPAPALADDVEAYGVQAVVAAALEWFGGGVPRHWKSGGPSRDAVQTHAPLPWQLIHPPPPAALGASELF